LLTLVILDEGEGQKIEFKEAVSSLDNDLVPFATASGGRIFLSMNDANEVSGNHSCSREDSDFTPDYDKDFFRC
jgi:predicted HTH transcriptional regulator